MRQSGRQSAADHERSLMCPRHDSVTNYVRPPPDLDATEHRIFVDLVAAVPGNHFRAGDLPLLVQYCRAVAMAERAVAELRAGGPVVDGKVNPWTIVHTRAARTMVLLATRLRLSPSSRSQPSTIARQSVLSGPAPWEDQCDTDAAPA
jgi:phage terminase small subunit